MKFTEIVLIIVLGLYVGSVIFKAIMDKKHGKCSCDCSCCQCQCCHKKSCNNQ